ncbi:hypothetical protein MASR1M46_12670 [Bacteroidales bacterium]
MILYVSCKDFINSFGIFIHSKCGNSAENDWKVLSLYPCITTITHYEHQICFCDGRCDLFPRKGIISASLAKLLQARGLPSVTIQKFDPHLNVDPGTLNPYEHGECYVTEDGAETDLDLGAL